MTPLYCLAAAGAVAVVAGAAGAAIVAVARKHYPALCQQPVYHPDCVPGVYDPTGPGGASPSL